MSADIVNLRRARKELARSTKEAKAATNRAKFGRTKAERMQSDALEDLAQKRHAAHSLKTVAVVDPVADADPVAVVDPATVADSIADHHERE